MGGGGGVSGVGNKAYEAHGVAWGLRTSLFSLFLNALQGTYLVVGTLVSDVDGEKALGRGQTSCRAGLCKSR